MVLGELGLLEQLVVELALELHDEKEHVIVGAAGEEDPATRSEVSERFAMTRVK